MAAGNLEEPMLIERRGPDMEALLGLTQVVYVLMAAGLLFSAGLVMIVGVIIDYVKLDDVRGTWLESHFRWQIRTFWIGLVLGATAGVLCLTIILLPFGILVGIADVIWILYRVIKGWLALNDRKALI